MKLFNRKKFDELTGAMKNLAKEARKNPKEFVKSHAKKKLVEAKHSTKELLKMIKSDPKEFFKLFGKVLWRNKLKYAILLLIAVVTIHIPTIRSFMTVILVRDICKHKNEK